MRRLALAASLPAFLLLQPAEAESQAYDDTCWLGALAGRAWPWGDLDHVAEPGGEFGVHVGCSVSQRLGLRGKVVGQIFGEPEGDERPASFNLLAGPDASLAASDRFLVRGGLALGLARIAQRVTEVVLVEAARRDAATSVRRRNASHAGQLLTWGPVTEANVRAGLHLGRWTIFGEGAFRVIFTGQDGYFLLSSFPLTAGLDYHW